MQHSHHYKYPIVYKMHTIRNKKITVKKHTGVWADSFHNKLKQYDTVL